NLNPNIDFPLLRKIHSICPVPLVLHGASGIPDDQISQMVNNGVIKINVASDLRRAYIKSAGKNYEKDPDRFDLVNVCLDAEEAVEKVVYHKINVMNKLSPEKIK
ncbi:class II fructose-bisphosphate aldolase, partial [Liquorilactobacillus vini]|uniref:class II fructose-bisphosphate aldolase n=1 Tax=Liquorilactobacillus vini TaxID=238015 RepID=UPI000557C895